MIVTAGARKKASSLAGAGHGGAGGSAEVLVVILTRRRLVRGIGRFLGWFTLVGPVPEGGVALDQMNSDAFTVRRDAVP
ncbi:MAG: hypothetical protein L3J97_03135 [Thermoplasmata archaeon]|nr:hypothetical protein [Thermoplasmata archaeon]